jgi:hypothetical protein
MEYVQSDLPLMKTILLLLWLGLMTAPLYGQAHIVKQRARELSEQNNARQGITPPPPAGSPARPVPTAPPQSGPPQPMVASPEVLRQYDLNTLKGDIAGIKPGATVGIEQTEKLKRNLTTASRGVSKPSEKMLGQLSEQLGAALIQANLTAANHAQLAEDLIALLNCGGVPTAQAQANITSVQATLQRGGVERKLAVAVANDLKLIVGEIQKGS